MNPSECKNKIVVTIPDGEHCDRCLFLMYVGGFYHSRYPYNHDKNLSMYKCYYYDEPLSYDVKCDCQIVGRATTLLSTQKACAVLEKVAKNLDGVSSVRNIDKVAGSEDCTWLIRKVVKHGGNHNGHHRSDFSIQDRESLPIGFGMFTGFLSEVNMK